MKNDFDIRRYLRYVIPVLVIILVVTTVIVFRSSLVPGWYGEGDDRYYLISS